MTDNPKHMKKIIYTLIIVALFVACDKENDFGVIGDGFAVSKDKIEIYAGGGTEEVLLTSGKDWSIIGKPGWIKVKNDKGNEINQGSSGSIVLKLTADVNTEEADLSGNIIIESSTSEQLIISVSQDAAVLKLSRKGTEVDLQTNYPFLWSDKAEASAMQIKIVSNTWWKIKIDREYGDSIYYDFNYREGEGDKTINVYPNLINTSEYARELKFHIEGPDPDDTRTFIINQDNLTFQLKMDGQVVEELACDEFGDTFENLRFESETSWKRNTDSKWELEGASSGYASPDEMVSTTFPKLTIKDNDTRDTVFHKIIFTQNTDPYVEKTLTVKQDPFIFEVENVNNKQYFANADSLKNPIELEVRASADWSVESKPSWISVRSDESGEGSVGGRTSSFSFAPVGQNLEYEKDREDKIVLKNVANKLTEEISVRQEKFEFDLINDSFSLKADPKNESSEYQEAKLITSGAWVVEECPDWLDMRKSKGSKDETFLYFKANETYTEDVRYREDSIKVVSKRHKDKGIDLYDYIHVKQDGYWFEINPASLNFKPNNAPSAKLEITSPTSWNIRQKPSWVTVTPSSSSSGCEVEVKVENNHSIYSREGVVKFYNSQINKGAGKYVNINITQDAYRFDVTFPNNGDKIYVDPVISIDISHTVNVVCSGEWTATATTSNGNTADWIGLVPMNDALMVKVLKDKPNTTLSSRTATIRIRNDDLGATKLWEISQNMFEFSVTGDMGYNTDDPMKFNALCDNVYYWLSYKCSSDIKIEVDDKLKDIIAYEKENGKITVSAKNNLTEEPISGTIRISPSMTTSYSDVVIAVEQAAYELEVSPTSVTNVPKDGAKNQSINVTCTGTWKGKTDVDWIEITAQNGNILLYTVKENTTGAQRNGKITITADNTNISREVRITQSK